MRESFDIIYILYKIELQFIRFTNNNYHNMDLNQQRLSKTEWLNIETPISETELNILNLIVEGYTNINIRKNDTLSLLSHMKMDYSVEIEGQLYKQYFEENIEDMKKKYLSVDLQKDLNPVKHKKKEIVLKGRDLIRIKSMDSKVNQHKHMLFEYILLDICDEILQSLLKKTPKYAFYLYTLIQLKKSSVRLINKHVIEFVDLIISTTSSKLKIRDVMNQAYLFIEKNPYLLKYEDLTLFQHQKQLFSIFKNNKQLPKLVLYMAPTGTGKTLSPIGLSVEHRIIFVCAARHVGLALAKSAISVGKRVAFAFGCETASDIRLHYFAAAIFTKNKKTGGIGKVDNSVGDKVEIMICDVQSYLIAMRYMLAFTDVSDDDSLPLDYDLITYWDEPTITMDYETHELHSIIHQNWKENKISKMVLSCATLPRESEIMDTIQDFKLQFPGAEINSIVSHDCRKSISLLNKCGEPTLPHFLFSDYDGLKHCVEHCIQNKTLLRYFDLKEIVNLIEYVHEKKGVLPERYLAETYFGEDISGITMNSIKQYYLEVLLNIEPTSWPSLYSQLLSKRSPKFMKPSIRKIRSMDQMINKSTPSFHRTTSVQIINTVPSVKPSVSSGILLTTEDAHTLTDGPTIFLSEDVEKVGKFYIQQTNISMRVFQGISEKIAQNNQIQQKIEALTRSLEDKAGKDLEKSNKVEKENLSSEVKKLMDQINAVRLEIKAITLDQAYIANSVQHQRLWVEDEVTAAFVPSVDDQSVRDIMELGVSDQHKLLLLLGIGVFSSIVNASPGHLAYIEIMKRLAYNQQLYLILASSDYIYGTNYQFCHGFIGKDLTNMTQQKTIQAMGRIGRSNIQQEYTIRFRDDAMLTQLFMPAESNKEAEIMSRLFHS